MAKKVFSGLVTACRLAGCPTSVSPSSLKATIEGVVRAPSAFSMTFGVLPSITATQELVVPRSMPMTLLAMMFSSWQAVSKALVARRPLPRVAGEQASVFVELEPRGPAVHGAGSPRISGAYIRVFSSPSSCRVPELVEIMTQGLAYHPGCLGRDAQLMLLDALRRAIAAAPLFTPVMPKTGKPFSVRMTNLGPLGWVSDRAGYRYQAHHPATGRPWPPMPDHLLALWRRLGGYPHDPEACLVNYYAGSARMGLHRDQDEADMAAPVMSLSLGDTALFRIGGPARRGPTRSISLASGDVLIMGGASRLCYHGVDRILAGTSTLLPEGGRINLTLRRVTLPD